MATVVTLFVLVPHNRVTVLDGVVDWFMVVSVFVGQIVLRWRLTVGVAVVRRIGGWDQLGVGDIELVIGEEMAGVVLQVGGIHLWRLSGIIVKVLGIIVEVITARLLPSSGLDTLDNNYDNEDSKDESDNTNSDAKNELVVLMRAGKEVNADIIERFVTITDSTLDNVSLLLRQLPQPEKGTVAGER